MFGRMSAAAAVLAVLVASQAASAADDADVVVMRAQVHYGDLNLSTPEGQAILRTRVEAAAAQACGGNPAFNPRFSVAPLFVRNDFEMCRAEALGKAGALLQAKGVASTVIARR